MNEQEAARIVREALRQNSDLSTADLSHLAESVIGALDSAGLTIVHDDEDSLYLRIAWHKFKRKVEVLDNGCWQWRGAINKTEGYGRFYARDRTGDAHRFSYIVHKGEVPEGLVLDHICRHRSCVNPDHLRPVTNAENVLSGVGLTAKYAKATHCHRGHPFDEKNTYVSARGNRHCKACRTAAYNKYRERQKAKRNAG